MEAVVAPGCLCMGGLPTSRERERSRIMDRGETILSQGLVRVKEKINMGRMRVYQRLKIKLLDKRFKEEGGVRTIKAMIMKHEVCYGR